MLFSARWLSRYVEIPGDARVLSESLTRCGMVVDQVEERAGDTVLDIDVPTNRVDAMNHVGIARELAVARDVPLQVPDCGVEEADPEAASRTSVEVEDPDGCPRYCARLVLGVEVGPSPPWMTELLEALGLRPVNNVVDVTNFVLWELGHPLHAFDLDRLDEERIVVRRARAGESLLTLDEVERELTGDDLVIADASRPVALAGIMGGDETSIDEGSSNVLLEGAWFDPLRVRRSARRLAMHTDASHRFERRPAIDGMVAALDRAARLVTEVAGGRVCRGLLDARAELPGHRRVSLTVARVNRLLGLELDAARVTSLLDRLGFRVEDDGDGLDVTVPYSRPDVERPEDLVEEVARHHGYDRLPSTLPALPPTTAAGSRDVLAERRLQGLCAAAGWREAAAMPLSSVEDQRHLVDEARLVRIENPISEKLSILRASLVPGLLAVAAHNLNRGAPFLRLFEVGRRFRASDDDERPVAEVPALALLACGPSRPPHWSGPGADADLFGLKGTVSEIGRRLGWPAWSWDARDVDGLAAGQAARLASGGEERGIAGRIDAEVARAFGIEEPVWVAEVDLQGLLATAAPELRVRPLPRYPEATRDLSVVLPVDVPWGDVVATVSGPSDLPLEEVALVDIYRGDDLPEGHRSLTLRFVYRAPDRTLTAEEIETAHGTLTGLLETELDARQR